MASGRHLELQEPVTDPSLVPKIFFIPGSSPFQRHMTQLPIIKSATGHHVLPDYMILLVGLIKWLIYLATFSNQNRNCDELNVQSV